MKVEQNYDFRKRYCKVHHRIPVQTPPNPDEWVLSKEISVVCRSQHIVAATGLKDFQKFLKTAFGIIAHTDQSNGDIVVAIDPNWGEYMARSITVTDNQAVITASDARGAAQAFYDLEAIMNRRRGPYLKKGTITKKPCFSPRMTHSGLGLDYFTDEYLSACAHHGFDAVLAFMRDPTHAAYRNREYDFNDLVKRAAKYGIDVYAYSYIKNYVHPNEPNAKETFDRTYGDAFRNIPGLKGMVFVGESIQFPSNDPCVNPLPHPQQPPDGIPDSRPRSGWWPCFDYVDWICLARNSIREANPDADVVFWSYNWGRQPKEPRIALLEKLPTDISLLVTFEMFDLLDLGNSVGMVNDYTIAHVGPGKYFISEAEVAKQRGIRLYAMVNTAGRTWDFGVAPYEPFPWQWNKRHKKLLESRDKYGLQGLMESHHYGFLPSFISQQAMEAFTDGGTGFESFLKIWAKNIAGDQWNTILNGMRCVDEAIHFYIPSNENQYGPYRIGPAYPFCLKSAIKKPNTPDMLFGNAIYNVVNQNTDVKKYDPYSLRVHDELRLHKLALQRTRMGLITLKHIPRKNAELKRLIDLVEYLMRCHQTAVNYKEFYIFRMRLLSCSNRDSLCKIAKRIKLVCQRELKNVEKTIPLVRRNSEFGYEPSMGYQCDEECLHWKQKHMEYVLQNELPAYLE